MYKGLEELYKKEGIYNKLMRNITIIFTIIVIIGFSLSFTKIDFTFVLTGTMTTILISTIIIISKTLNIKISFNFKENIVNEIINQKNEDKIKIINYLRKNNLYSENTIKLMIEHYRKQIPSYKKTNNFWSILAVIYAIAIAVYNNGEYLDINFLVYLLSIFTIYLFFYQIYKHLGIYINCLKGNDGLYESLEEILSEIYSELINKKTSKNKILNFIKLLIE